MSSREPSTETKAKIMLDEANLTFCETAERKDSAGERRVDGSVWDDGKMDGEFDQEDYNRILELQMRAAKICDERMELEEKTAGMFQGITADNAEEVMKQVKAQPDIMELACIAVTIFILRFPTAQSYVNKGHPLVLATDEYMLENSDVQNWYDYKLIAEEFGWK